MREVKLLFFASLAERVGCREKIVHLENHIDTVIDLVDFLCQTDGNWTALKARNIKIAVNQSIASDSDPIREGDEIAFFPPVTGG